MTFGINFWYRTQKKSPDTYILWSVLYIFEYTLKKNTYDELSRKDYISTCDIDYIAHYKSLLLVFTVINV